MTHENGDRSLAWQQAEPIDLSGLKCPMPALMTGRALRRINPGDLIAVTVTDPMAPLDIRHLCQRDGHDVVDEARNEKGARRFLLRRGPRSD